MEVKWIEHKGRKILSIDYTGIKMEREMIAHLNSVPPFLKDVTKGDNLYAVSDLTGCYATPGFIDAAKKMEKEVFSQYKLKWAILGIAGPKAILLKAFNLVSKIKLEPFNTQKDALEYLCKDK
jgi:hypothetical protein